MDAVRKPPVSLPPDHTLYQAAELMNAAVVGALVVVDEEDRPLGVVTDRDLVVRAMARQLPLDGRIDSVMSTDLITIDADADLHDAIGIFRTHAIRRLPVLRDGKLAGVLALDDLIIDITSDLANVTRPVMGEVIFGHPEVEVPATI